MAVAVGVAETGVCVVVGSVVEAVGDTAALGVAAVVDGVGDAVPCVGVAVSGEVGSGVVAGDAVGFAVVGVGVVRCAVADGCTGAALGVAGTGGAATA